MQTSSNTCVGLESHLHWVQDRTLCVGGCVLAFEGVCVLYLDVAGLLHESASILCCSVALGKLHSEEL